jgi:hypothetical protein
MGRRSHEDGQAKLFGKDVQASDVVGVFVGNEDAGERLRCDALSDQATAEFAARKATIDKQTGFRGCEDRAVAPAARG